MPGAVLQMGHKRRRPHQVGDGLPQIALRVQAQVVSRHRAAPDDLVFVVQQQHTVGRSLDGRQKLVQPVPLCGQSLLAQAQRALDAVAHLTPEAGVTRGVALLRAAQPAHQPAGAQHIDQHHGTDADGRADQGAGLGQPQQRTGQQAQAAAQGQRQQRGQQAWQQPDHRRAGRRAQAATGLARWVSR